MVIALDIGTSSTRATVYDAQARPVPGRFHQVQHDPVTTADGGVEHDASLLLEAVGACLDAVLAGPRPPEIDGIGISTFWHGLVGFDAADRASTPVFTWADSRSALEADLLRGALDEDTLHARTGCHFHASYWPAKIRWLTRARPDEVRRVVRWGSVGEFIELALLGAARTSVSMASGTGLLNQDSVAWDGEAMAAAGVDERQLFPLVDRTDARRGLRGPWAARWPALRRAVWFPAVGDGAAGSIGSDCIEPGRIALNLGTSAALRVVTTQPSAPPRGLWRYRVDRRRSIVGGATSEGGNVWAWCQDVLRLPNDAAVEAALVEASPDGHGLTMLPFLAGERSPGWRAARRGAVTGLSLDTTALEIVHAALEAVALRLALVYELLRPHATADHLVVGSGGALGRSPAWTRMIADALGHAVTLFSEAEATSRGVAKLTLEALGTLPDLSAARAPLGREFAPDPARHARLRGALARQRLLAERV
jgi:gluconokinase